MNVLLPGKALASYIEAYYVSTDLRQNSLDAQFPAISTGYIKFSPTTAVVSGQATGPTTVHADSGSAAGLGVKLRPGAFHVLFGVPAHELTDRVIRLEEILGSAASELHEQIAQAPTSAIQIQHFERKFARFVQKRRDSTAVTEQQMVTLLRDISASRVSSLAESLGYSPRQFQRKLNELVGFSPRLYRRIARFEKALELMQRSSKRGKTNWAALAVRCGYSDQAHFIRDFRQFAGQTPTSYLASLQGN